MRLESNQMKINASRICNIQETGEFRLQSIQGRFFAENECVLWDKVQRDYVRDGKNGVIIFNSPQEMCQYIESIEQDKEKNDFEY